MADCQCSYTGIKMNLPCISVSKSLPAVVIISYGYLFESKSIYVGYSSHLKSKR